MMSSQMTKTRKDGSPMIKKWKPTYLEVTMLKCQFPQKQVPSQQDRQQLSKRLRENFDSDVSANELQEWFEEEMSKTTKCLKKDNLSTSPYIKLTPKETTMLEENFDMKNYPSVEEMQKMADKLGVNTLKIENWFKHHRRTLAKKGQFDIKSKKYFKPNELVILMDLFTKTSRPDQQQMSVVAKQLSCTVYQIKNWYCNKRKRVRFQSQSEENETTDEAKSLKSLENSSSSAIDSPQDFSISHQPLLFSTQLASTLADNRLGNWSFKSSDLTANTAQSYYPQNTYNKPAQSWSGSNQLLLNLSQQNKEATYQENILSLIQLQNARQNNMMLNSHHSQALLATCQQNQQRFQNSRQSDLYENLMSYNKASTAAYNILAYNSQLRNSQLRNLESQIIIASNGDILLRRGACN